MDYREGMVAPPFVRLKQGATDPSKMESWDGWVVEPTGDDKADYLTGAGYADMALRKVNATGNPGALTFPLSEMMRKLFAGEIKKGAIEMGFMDRLVHLASERLEQLTN